MDHRQSRDPGKKSVRVIAGILTLTLSVADPLALAAAPVMQVEDPLNLDLIDNPLAAILAQSVDRPGRSESGGSYRGEASSNQPAQLSPTITHNIVQNIISARKECALYNETYRVDCLRQGIDMTISQMPDTGEYAKAKQILRRASTKLARIVEKYQDPNAPRLEAKRDANPRFRKRRSYAAIRQAAVPKALKEANAVIAEATTALLRSSENSERRYAHYQQISVAVDSTKVLLRSL